jgi:hypothetical protein
MPTLNTMLRAAPVAMVALALLAGCDRPKTRQRDTGPPGPIGAPAAPVPATPSVAGSAQAAPAPPTWAQAYLGQVLSTAIPTQSTTCVGNTDDVELRYRGATPGVKVEGWGWDNATRKPVQHVLLVDDHSGEVVGAGQTGKPRPDVVRARPEVTSPTTGWEATTTATGGGIYAYGLVAGGKAVCRLGHLGL